MCDTCYILEVWIGTYGVPSLHAAYLGGLRSLSAIFTLSTRSATIIDDTRPTLRSVTHLRSLVSDGTVPLMQEGVTSQF